MLNDLRNIGLSGLKVDLVTAFYSRQALACLEIAAKSMRVICRLDMHSIDEWKNGYISPDGLLDFVTQCRGRGTNVALYAHEGAHAKLYVGHAIAMIGSSNLTMHGFGGGYEMMLSTNSRTQLSTYRKAVTKYARRCTPIRLEDLQAFVDNNTREIEEYRRNHRIEVDRLPSITRDNQIRFGDYANYLNWLGRRADEASIEILARANGKGNLQGHIHRNFYGLRQYFLANPISMHAFSNINPDDYSLAADPLTEAALRSFVYHNLVDEADFKRNIWKTYLPEECGGRAARHGGTIGNLNRMLPLVARYLKNKLRSS